MSELKEMTNAQLLFYFTKLIKSNCNEESREYRKAKEEISHRLESKTRYVTEKGTLVGQPVNILVFSEEELEILEDLTSESHFYTNQSVYPIHRKILTCLEALRQHNERGNDYFGLNRLFSQRKSENKERD